MNPKTYCAISAVVFAVVAAAQLLRALNGWPVTIAAWQVSTAPSWAAAGIAGALSVWGFRQATRST